MQALIHFFRKKEVEEKGQDHLVGPNRSTTHHEAEPASRRRVVSAETARAERKQMKRIIVLVAMTMVAVMLLSGPVAQVLEVPGDSTAEAKKKKKKKKRNKVVTINCPNGAGNNCVGTTGRDRLIGTNARDNIAGRAGNDIYDSNGGSDNLSDSRGNDYYYESVLNFGDLRITDNVGTNVLDLSRRYESDDFDLEWDGDDLVLQEVLSGPGDGTNSVRIIDYRDAFRDGNSFFYFKFSDGLANDALQDASASEQAEVQEQVDADAPAGEQISTNNEQETTNPENTDS
jgi:hypothetical protein